MIKSQEEDIKREMAELKTKSEGFSDDVKAKMIKDLNEERAMSTVKIKEQLAILEPQRKRSEISVATSAYNEQLIAIDKKIDSLQ
ncbi:MAG: hypothetical protein LBN09_02790 [Clostridioides sp.]|jgi:hypothetical protein|nr:hypothetical protein [Clostridioides sp.]